MDFAAFYGYDTILARLIQSDTGSLLVGIRRFLDDLETDRPGLCENRQF